MELERQVLYCSVLHCTVLARLQLSRVCSNRWSHHQGTCYYFSSAQVGRLQLGAGGQGHYIANVQETATWAEAQTACRRLNRAASLAMPKTMAQNRFLALSDHDHDHE